MSVPLRRVALGAIATGLLAALTACGAAPTPAASGSGSGSAAASKATSSYLPCIVSDQGGFDDHAFNELGLDGVKDAAKKIGSTYKAVQSATANDYASNIDNLVSQKCNSIVALGFNLVASVKAAATANPSTNFVMVDDNSIKAANVKPVVFETDEAAFLGGYAAAAYSKTGVVATWGGLAIPPVTIYMDGIADGIAYFNKQKSKSVKLLGWNEATQKGVFVGNFTDLNKAKTISTNFLSQDADVVIPVAGALYPGAAAAIKASGKTGAVIEGVDADLFQTDTTGNQSIILTSILKQVGTATSDVLTAAASAKTFDTSTYVGTLKNGGVGLAPFHDYSSKIPSTLEGELKTIQQGIIDGSIAVDSPSSLKK